LFFRRYFPLSADDIAMSFHMPNIFFFCLFFSSSYFLHLSHAISLLRRFIHALFIDTFIFIFFDLFSCFQHAIPVFEPL